MHASRGRLYSVTACVAQWIVPGWVRCRPRMMLGIMLAALALLGVAFYLVDTSLTRPYWIEGMRWSADGKRLIVTYKARTLEVSSWDAAGNRTTSTVIGKSKWAAIHWSSRFGPEDAITGLSPDETLIYGMDRNSKVLVWDLATKEKIPVPAECNENDAGGGQVYAREPVWNPLRREMAMSSNSGTYVWHVNTETPCLARKAESLWPVCWTPDGTGLVFYEDKHHFLYNTATKVAHELPAMYECADLAWSKDGSMLCAKSASRTYLVVFHVNTGTQTQLSGFNHCDSYAWSPDGKKIAVMDLGKSNFDSNTPAVRKPLLHIWDVETGRLIHSIPVSPYDPDSLDVSKAANMAWSRDSRRIASCHCIRHIKGRPGYRGRILAFGLKWWDAASGKEMAEKTVEISDRAFTLPYTNSWTLNNNIFTEGGGCWSPDLDRIAISTENSLLKMPDEPFGNYGCYSDIRIVTAPAEALSVSTLSAANDLSYKDASYGYK